jgi:hypothetical protein
VVVNRACSKLFRVREMVIGGAGNSAALELAIQWWRDGCKKNRIPTIEKDKDGETPVALLILHPRGRIEFMDGNFQPIPAVAPAAVGLGRDYARAAMLLGKPPREAVEFVAEHMPMIGGKITEMRPGLAVRRKR